MDAIDRPPGWWQASDGYWYPPDRLHAASNESGKPYLKYWLVTAAAVVVFLVVLFWRPSVTYTAPIYREPDYVQTPYLAESSATCESMWSISTGGLHAVAIPQYPPPAGESPAEYLGLLTSYKGTLAARDTCDTRRENFGLILAAAVAVAVTSEVLRRRKKAADAASDAAPADVPLLIPH